MDMDIQRLRQCVARLREDFNFKAARREIESHLLEVMSDANEKKRLKINSIRDYSVWLSLNQKIVDLTITSSEAFIMRSDIKIVIETNPGFLKPRSASLLRDEESGELYLLVKTLISATAEPRFGGLQGAEGVKNMLVENSLDYIRDYLDDYLTLSKTFVRTHRPILENVPLAHVSLACWQARNTYLSSKEDGVASNLCTNYAKSTLSKRLKAYAEKNDIDRKKYASYIDLPDSLIDYLDRTIPTDYETEDIKLLSPVEFFNAYSEPPLPPPSI